LDKSFWKYLLEKPHSYIGVWTFFYANSDDDGVFTTPYPYVLSRFKLSRSSLQRIVDFGTKWAENGQKVGRKWADKELTIIFTTTISGQKVGRKWAESGQIKRVKKPSIEPIEVKQIESTKLDAEDLEKIQISFRSKEKQKSDKLFPLMVEAYDEFCKQRMDMGAKMNPHQGKAMKSIILYLANQIKNKRGEIPEEQLKTEILAAWNYILGNWSKINGYFAEQIKLSQIDSNLPNLLVQLRNNKTTARDEKFANRESQIRGISFD
jgi:hypothetical protein